MESKIQIHLRYQGCFLLCVMSSQKVLSVSGSYFGSLGLLNETLCHITLGGLEKGLLGHHSLHMVTGEQNS